VFRQDVKPNAPHPSMFAGRVDFRETGSNGDLQRKALYQKEEEDVCLDLQIESRSLDSGPWVIRVGRVSGLGGPRVLR